jgi:hypothetical protein
VVYSHKKEVCPPRTLILIIEGRYPWALTTKMKGMHTASRVVSRSVIWQQEPLSAEEVEGTSNHIYFYTDYSTGKHHYLIPVGA